MKTPINGARLSHHLEKETSYIGIYKNAFTTDFAAPTGTPIMVSGDGVVTMTMVRWWR